MTRHLNRRLAQLRRREGESGTTLVELIMTLTAGMIVFGAVTMLMLMTIRQTGRVTTHVEANQRARVAMTKIVNDLHSACFFPQVKPVQEGSTGDKLIFWHQSGDAVAPTPVQSEIELVNGELIEREAQPLSGEGLSWNFAKSPTGTEVELMKGVSPLSESEPIFRYYSFVNGKISSSPLAANPLGGAAPTAVQVSIAFRAEGESPIVGDEGAATGIQDAVLLRLTPPSYASSSDNPPCE